MTDLRMSILEVREVNKKLSTVRFMLNKQIKERKEKVEGVYTDTCGVFKQDRLRVLATSLWCTIRIGDSEGGKMDAELGGVVRHLCCVNKESEEEKEAVGA